MAVERDARYGTQIESREMQITLGRILGLLIAIAYVLLAVASYGLTTGLKVCVILLLPLALIWFPDELGSLTGIYIQHSLVNRESPPVLICLMGWFFLVGLPLLLMYIWR